MKNKWSFVLVALILVSFLACKNDERGKASISVRLHDTPIDADSVIVEILEVRIHTEQDGWQTLQTNDGLYDLLELQNGVDTLLVPVQEIPEGSVSQIRFILGGQNTIVIDDVSYPLALSSQDESGLKLNIHQELEDGQNYLLVVDFDAGESVLQTGNDTYKLKPVLSASFQ